MANALRTAGILDQRPGKEATTLHFIPEPEAATLAIISDRLQKPTSSDLDVILY